jgi:hypothetical protein
MALCNAQQRSNTSFFARLAALQATVQAGHHALGATVQTLQTSHTSFFARLAALQATVQTLRADVGLVAEALVGQVGDSEVAAQVGPLLLRGNEARHLHAKLIAELAPAELAATSRLVRIASPSLVTGPTRRTSADDIAHALVHGEKVSVEDPRGTAVKGAVAAALASEDWSDCGFAYVLDSNGELCVKLDESHRVPHVAHDGRNALVHGTSVHAASTDSVSQLLGMLRTCIPLIDRATPRALVASESYALRSALSFLVRVQQVAPQAGITAMGDVARFRTAIEAFESKKQRTLVVHTRLKALAAASAAASGSAAVPSASVSGISLLAAAFATADAASAAVTASSQGSSSSSSCSSSSSVSAAAAAPVASPSDPAHENEGVTVTDETSEALQRAGTKRPAPTSLETSPKPKVAKEEDSEP